MKLLFALYLLTAPYGESIESGPAQHATRLGSFESYADCRDAEKALNQLFKNTRADSVESWATRCSFE